MSIQLIRKALEKRLGSMTPALATAFENVAFTPAAGTPYQRVNLLPATPDNATLGDAYYRENGLFQVTLLYPQLAGPAAAEARAEAVRAHFKRGTSITESGVTTLITRTPSIAPALIDGDRYVIPITITYQAEIN